MRALSEKHLLQSMRLRIQLGKIEKIVSFNNSSGIKLSFYEGLSDQGLFIGENRWQVRDETKGKAF